MENREIVMYEFETGVNELVYLTGENREQALDQLRDAFETVKEELEELEQAGKITIETYEDDKYWIYETAETTERIVLLVCTIVEKFLAIACDLAEEYEEEE